MQWTITIEGTDEFGAAHRGEVQLEKDFTALADGTLGLSIADGKAIMAQLQEIVVRQQCEMYVVARRFCMDCQRLLSIKDYTVRKIRTVFGTVEVPNPRIMNCPRCLPHFCFASVVLHDICPDQATPELMELSARLGSLMPYRKAADVIAEFLPVNTTESFGTVRHRTLALGKRLDDKADSRAWFDPPDKAERDQIELEMPNDPNREFVLSIDTAHIRSASKTEARTFEIAVARCGRGTRGSRPGHYFATADTSKQGLRLAALQALQREGYEGRGEITVLSDGAEILKRLPHGLPRPTRHIIDWFHIAMKLQPLIQVADHISRKGGPRPSKPSAFGDEIRSLKWNLWQGQVDRAIEQLSEICRITDKLRKAGDLAAGRVWQLARPLLTYIRLNRQAIVGYGARYRSGRRVSMALAESAVNSVTGWLMAKLQQMRWWRRGAHLMLQVRAAVMKGTLHEQLRYEPPVYESRLSAFTKPVPPLFRSVGNPG